MATSWNYRVVKETGAELFDGLLLDGDEWYTIREVYYDSDGAINGYTEDSVGVCGSSIDELRETLEWMLHCLDQPVLVESEIELSQKVAKNQEV